MAYRKNEALKENIQNQEGHKQGLPNVTVDYEKYLHHLNDAEATDEEKIAYIQTLAALLIQFVDLGFGVHPAVPLPHSGCGKPHQKSSKVTLTAPDEVCLRQVMFSDNFVRAAGPDKDSEAGEVE